MAKSVGTLGVAALFAIFGVGLNQSTAPSPAPTFYKDVLPILQNHCQTCHRPGEIGPFPLL